MFNRHFLSPFSFQADSSAYNPPGALKVDALMDFGPLSKKLKKNADLSPPVNAGHTSHIPSGRRFSTFAASLPRAQQYPVGRKSSVQLLSSPSLSLPPPQRSSPPLQPPQRSSPPLQPPSSFTLPRQFTGEPLAGAPSKVNEDPQQYNTVGGLIKLFSAETQGSGSIGVEYDKAVDNNNNNGINNNNGKKKLIPAPLRLPPANSPPPSSARLLVRRYLDRLIDWLIDWLVGWLVNNAATNWLFGSLIVCFFDWLIGRQFDWMIDWMIDWLLVRLFAWLFDWLVDWLIDWLIDWLSEWFFGENIRNVF